MFIKQFYIYIYIFPMILHSFDHWFIINLITILKTLLKINNLTITKEKELNKTKQKWHKYNIKDDEDLKNITGTIPK